MRAAVLIACLPLAQPAFSQTPSEGPIVDWLVNKEVSIRKTFDGKSKDESEPARFGYNNPNFGSTFWLIDLGVKFSEWDLCANCTGKSIIFYPTLEWHRSTSDIEATHKLKVGPSVDIVLGDLTKRPAIPIVLLKAGYERDALKDTNSGSLSVLGGAMGANRAGGGNTWLPMSHVNDKNGNLVFRYAPYAGFEYYSNLVIEKKGFPSIPAINLSAFAAHVQLDFYPFNRASRPGWLEITTSYAFRRRIGGDAQVGDKLTAISASSNVYFDTARHFAVGYDYESGKLPKNNFDEQHSTGVGFKVKF